MARGLALTNLHLLGRKGRGVDEGRGGRGEGQNGPFWSPINGGSQRGAKEGQSF